MSEAGGISRRRLIHLAGGAGLAAAAGCSGAARHPGAPPTGTTSAAAGTGTARTPTPGTTAPVTALAALSARLSSPLLRPGDSGYARAVALYNPRFDRDPRPVAIARCRSSADVVACVRAVQGGVPPLRLRAGGHSYGGWSSGPGLVVDVRPMSSVTLDRAAGTVRIGAGARLAEVYAALGQQGVAVAGGSCPSVGITGLTLGGGVGVLTRAFGLTCDALRSVELVTADGALREVDARRHADLFWALRGGGGGSFGAVTALTLAVRPAPTVHLFFLSWERGHAPDVLAAWQRWLPGRDAALWSTCKVLATPADGRVRVLVAGTWIGAGADLDRQLAPLLAAVGAPPRARSSRTLGYEQAMLQEAGCRGKDVQQCLTDALGPAQRRPFAATSAILRTALPPGGVEAAVAGASRALEVAETVEGGVSFDALGGRVDDLAPEATAFAHRGALATVQFTATWPRAGTDPARFDAYVRRQRAGLAPWTGQAAYVNYADPAIGDAGRAYWGDHLPRLREVKRTYDPHELFTFPQAVRP